MTGSQLLAGAWAVLLAMRVAGELVAPATMLRVPAGLLLAFVAPGAALLAAVRPARVPLLALAVLSVPLSLAVLALAGVAVDHLPGGLHPETAAGLATLVTLGCLAVAVARDLPRQGPLVGPAFRRPWRGAVHGPGLRLHLRRFVAHLRDPLFRNAYALGLSGVVTSALGVVYWGAAARLYPTEVVGIGAALLSLVNLLANVAQLNLRSGFGRFVPVAGNRGGRLLRGGYLASTLVAAVGGVATVGVLAVAPSLAGGAAITPQLAVLFPITVVLFTVFSVQDHALIALRRSTIVPVENGLFALGKIVVLVLLASAATPEALLLSWTIPCGVAVAIVTTWVLGRVVPDLTRHPHGEEVPARTVVTFVGADYAGSLLAIGAASVLPILVLASLGPVSSAHAYVVSLISAGAQLVPTVLATSLLVEVAAGAAGFARDGRRVIRQLAVLLGPIVVVLVLFADPILRIFGPGYAEEGATALRLLGLAAIPFAAITLALIRLRLEGRVRRIVAVQAVLAVGVVIPVALLLPVLGITAIGLVTLLVEGAVAAWLAVTELRPLVGGRAQGAGEGGADGRGEPDAEGPGERDAGASATAMPSTRATDAA